MVKAIKSYVKDENALDEQVGKILFIVVCIGVVMADGSYGICFQIKQITLQIRQTVTVTLVLVLNLVVTHSVTNIFGTFKSPNRALVS